MEFFTSLPELRQYLGNSSIATIGIDFKDIDEFHDGHKECIKELKKVGADYTMAFLLDEKNIRADYEGREPVLQLYNMPYMREWLEKEGIDIFYFCDLNDWKTHWVHDVEFQTLIDESKVWLDAKDYGLNAKWEEIMPYFLAIWRVQHIKQIWNRTHTVMSMKEGRFRVVCLDYLREMTDITPIVVNTVKDEYDNALSSGMFRLAETDKGKIKKKLMGTVTEGVVVEEEDLMNIEGQTHKWTLFRVGENLTGINDHEVF